MAEFLCRWTSLVAEPPRKMSGKVNPLPKNYSTCANSASYSDYTHTLTFFTQGQIHSMDRWHLKQNTVPALKRCVALKIIVTNRPVTHHLHVKSSRYYLSNCAPSTYRFDLKPLAIFSTWETHIPSDMCSPTNITRDMCLPGRGTRVIRDICFPCRVR